MPKLPRPHYEPRDSDPQWLTLSVQFHGHLGPWATAGARLGMAGLYSVDAEGYFDVEVECEGPFVKPPQSCFLDGLQVATGATWGKRNLSWKRSDQIVVRIRNTRTGRRAEIRPTAKLMKMLGSFTPRPKAVTSELADEGRDRQPDDATVEGLARQIARMPAREILTMTRVDR